MARWNVISESRRAAERRENTGPHQIAATTAGVKPETVVTPRCRDDGVHSITDKLLKVEVGCMSKDTKGESQAVSERQALSAHLEAVREGERKRIAMEIHDELGQLLTALRIEVSLLRQKLLPDSIAVQKAEEMRMLIETIMGVVRSVVNQLRPAALNFGIVPALEWLAEDFRHRAQIACCLHVVGPEPCLSEMHATGVFRIVQESLTNIARHSSASQVEIRLTKSDSEIDLVVRDNGQGFDMLVDRLGSYGFLGMAERARMMDAHLKIDSHLGSGSVIRLRIQDDPPRS